MMVSVVAQVLLGIACGYVVATLSESLLHRRVGHACRIRRRRRINTLLNFVHRASFRHAVVHHRWTFRTNHVTQFDSTCQKAQVDDCLQRIGDTRIESLEYGLRPAWTGFATYNLAAGPTLVLVHWAAGPWAVFAAAPIFIVTPVLSRFVHPYLHRDHISAVHDSPWWVGRLLRTRYFRAVARHHFLHHKYPNSNFNLLLGGDWLLGVHRGATTDDLREMEQIGLRID